MLLRGELNGSVKRVALLAIDKLPIYAFVGNLNIRVFIRVHLLLYICILYICLIYICYYIFVYYTFV